MYYRDVADGVANHLRGTALAEDLKRLTGLRVERRAEGVLLVDTANFSAERFPGTGSVAQVAMLLAVEMADRIVDPDGRRVKRIDGAEPVGPAGRADRADRRGSARGEPGQRWPASEDDPPDPSLRPSGDEPETTGFRSSPRASCVRR